MKTIVTKHPDKTIVLDVDGVLANFSKAAFFACRPKASPKAYRKYLETYPGGVWDFAETVGLSTQEFWRCIDKTCARESFNFWVGVPAYPQAKSFFNSLRALAPVILCTAASEGLGFWSGRAEWLRDVLGVAGARVPLIIMRNASKGLIAADNAVLVDDNDKNVNEFIAAGGKAELFPRRWNSSHLVAQMLGEKSVYGHVLARVEGALR